MHKKKHNNRGSSLVLGLVLVVVALVMKHKTPWLLLLVVVVAALAKIHEDTKSLCYWHQLSCMSFNNRLSSTSTCLLLSLFLFTSSFPFGRAWLAVLVPLFMTDILAVSLFSLSTFLAFNRVLFNLFLLLIRKLLSFSSFRILWIGIEVGFQLWGDLDFIWLEI